MGDGIFTHALGLIGHNAIAGIRPLNITRLLAARSDISMDKAARTCHIGGCLHLGKINTSVNIDIPFRFQRKWYPVVVMNLCQPKMLARMQSAEHVPHAATESGREIFLWLPLL
jgi:hypothetical protein